VCRDCRLRRYENWVLDHEGAAVLCLVWTSPNGTVVRVRPFPPMRGLPATGTPAGTVDVLYPDVPVGREPTCRPEGDWT
jgi:hypothetical protein